MKPGVWHQFGHQSQTLAADVIERGVGGGVVLSPRDLSLSAASAWASRYRSAGVDVIVDTQFHVPTYTNKTLATYGCDSFRESVASLGRMNAVKRRALSKRLETINRTLHATAVLAPAAIHEAGQGSVLRLNTQLFDAARGAGQALGLPVYATVVFGNSVLAAPEPLSRALAAATALHCQGFYFACEFQERRVPMTQTRVRVFLESLVTMALTAQPVMHAYAGPMAILSLAAGAHASAIGHWHNLWQFDRGRFAPPADARGGPATPPPQRFFSRSLWGTIVYPDETVQLPQRLRTRVMTHSPFSDPAASGAEWRRGDAHRHLVHSIGGGASAMLRNRSVSARLEHAVEMLRSAEDLHEAVGEHLTLRDRSASYQQPWRHALEELVRRRGDDIAELDGAI